MATVQCAVSKGDFPIEFSWYHNEKKLSDITDGILISKTNKRISTLSIDSVQAKNIGEYKCQVKNPAGIVVYSAFLHVNG